MRCADAGRPIAAMLLAAMVLVACGTGKGAAGAGERGQASPSAGTGGSSTATGPATGSVSPVPSGDAQSLLLSAADLGADWRLSTPPHAGFRMTVCGVDLEPSPPRTQARTRLAQSALGPFVYQHVRVHADSSIPTAVVSRLTAALPGCTSFTTRAGESPDGPEATFTVEPLTVAGLPSQAVAWRMTPASGTPVQDLVLLPRAEKLIALMSVDVAGNPDPRVLERALRVVMAR